MTARVLGLTQTVLIVVMLGFAVPVCLILTGSAAGWWKSDVVLSGSMEPTYPVGSVVFGTEKDTRALRVGDVLMFTAPIEGHPKVMHRIVKVGHDTDGTLTVQTKGDANEENDYWTARVSTPTALVVDRHVPYVGYLLHRPLYVGLTVAGLIVLLAALGFLQSALESDETGRSPDPAPPSGSSPPLP